MFQQFDSTGFDMKKVEMRGKAQRWTKEEDERLMEAIQRYGTKKWTLLAQHVGTKTSHQCHQHWTRVLNPAIVKDEWSEDEYLLLARRVAVFGEASWKRVADGIPGRTDIQCRQRWQTLKSARFDTYRQSLIDRSSRMPVPDFAAPMATPSLSASSTPSIPSTPASFFGMGSGPPQQQHMPMPMQLQPSSARTTPMGFNSPPFNMGMMGPPGLTSPHLGHPQTMPSPFGLPSPSPHSVSMQLAPPKQSPAPQISVRASSPSHIPTFDGLSDPAGALQEELRRKHTHEQMAIQNQIQVQLMQLQQLQAMYIESQQRQQAEILQEQIRQKHQQHQQQQQHQFMNVFGGGHSSLPSPALSSVSSSSSSAMSAARFNQMDTSSQRIPSPSHSVAPPPGFDPSPIIVRSYDSAGSASLFSNSGAAALFHPASPGRRSAVVSQNAFRSPQQQQQQQQAYVPEPISIMAHHHPQHHHIHSAAATSHQFDPLSTGGIIFSSPALMNSSPTPPPPPSLHAQTAKDRGSPSSRPAEDFGAFDPGFSFPPKASPPTQHVPIDVTPPPEFSPRVLVAPPSTNANTTGTAAAVPSVSVVPPNMVVLGSPPPQPQSAPMPQPAAATAPKFVVGQNKQAIAKARRRSISAPPANFMSEGSSRMGAARVLSAMGLPNEEEEGGSGSTPEEMAIRESARRMAASSEDDSSLLALGSSALRLSIEQELQEIERQSVSHYLNDYALPHLPMMMPMVSTPQQQHQEEPADQQQKSLSADELPPQPSSSSSHHHQQQQQPHRHQVHYGEAQSHRYDAPTPPAASLDVDVSAELSSFERRFSHLSVQEEGEDVPTEDESESGSQRRPSCSSVQLSLPPLSQQQQLQLQIKGEHDYIGQSLTPLQMNLGRRLSVPYFAPTESVSSPLVHHHLPVSPSQHLHHLHHHHEPAPLFSINKGFSFPGPLGDGDEDEEEGEGQEEDGEEDHSGGSVDTGMGSSEWSTTSNYHPRTPSDARGSSANHLHSPSSNEWSLSSRQDSLAGFPDNMRASSVDPLSVAAAFAAARGQDVGCDMMPNPAELHALLSSATTSASFSAFDDFWATEGEAMALSAGMDEVEMASFKRKLSTAFEDSDFKRFRKQSILGMPGMPGFIPSLLFQGAAARRSSLAMLVQQQDPNPRRLSVTWESRRPSTPAALGMGGMSGGGTARSALKPSSSQQAK